MAVILEISSFRSLVSIRLDNHEQYWIHRRDFGSMGLSEGMTVNPDSLIERIRQLQYPRAINLAVAMLARRPCSTAEIRFRLERCHMLPQVADRVTEKLIRENLLNDAAFCDQWIRYRSGMHYGPGRIMQELKMKGISREMAESALTRYVASDQEDHAVVLAQKAWKRIRSDEDPRKSRQKVINALLRKGYSWDTARKACESTEKQRESTNSTAHRNRAVCSLNLFFISVRKWPPGPLRGGRSGRGTESS